MDFWQKYKSLVLGICSCAVIIIQALGYLTEVQMAKILAAIASLSLITLSMAKNRIETKVDQIEQAVVANKPACKEAKRWSPPERKS